MVGEVFDFAKVVNSVMLIEQTIVNDLTEEGECMLYNADLMKKYFPWKTEYCFEYVKYFHEVRRESESSTFADSIIAVYNEMRELRAILFNWNRLTPTSRENACRSYREVFMLVRRLINDGYSCYKEIAPLPSLIRNSSRYCYEEKLDSNSHSILASR